MVAALNILAVCDPAGEYGKRLGDYAQNRAGYPFALQTFSSLDQLLVYREKREPEAVLLASELYQEKEWQDYKHPLFLLGSGIGEKEEPPCIFRYQEAGAVLGEVLALYRKKQPRFAMKVEKRTFTLYAVTDAVESSRSELLAFFLAEKLAETEKVLWLDLRTWPALQEIYGCGVNGDLGELLYGLCRKRDDLIEQMLASVSSLCKVDLLPSVTEPADLAALTTEHWNYLFDRLKRESPYTVVLVVVGNLIQPLGTFLELFDVIWMVWEEKQMACQNRLERYVKATACPQLWQKIKGIQLPEEMQTREADQQALRHLAMRILEEDDAAYGRKQKA